MGLCEEGRSLTELTTPSIGLALGGGAARGIAHIQALHALDDLGVKPTRIAGTSIGSLMGVAYAAGLSAQVIEDHARSVLSNRLDAARLAFSSGKGGVLDLVRFNPLSSPLVDGPQLVRLVLPDGVPDRLEHLAIAMDVVTCDFYGAREIPLSSGPTVEAVAASIAIPGLISAPSGDETLIDGGCVNPVPINHLQDLDIIAAVDVVGKPEARGREAPRTPDLMAGAMQIQQRTIAALHRRNNRCDIWLEPAVSPFRVHEFFRFEEILAASKPLRDQMKRALETALEARVKSSA
jgi:NTE family protein